MGEGRRERFVPVLERVPRRELVLEPAAGSRDRRAMVLTPFIPSPCGRGETMFVGRSPSPGGRGGQGVRTSPRREQAPPDRQGAFPDKQGTSPDDQGTSPDDQGTPPDDQGTFPTIRGRLPTIRGRLPTIRGRLPTASGRLLAIRGVSSPISRRRGGQGVRTGASQPRSPSTSPSYWSRIRAASVSAGVARSAQEMEAANFWSIVT